MNALLHRVASVLALFCIFACTHVPQTKTAPAAESEAQHRRTSDANTNTDAATPILCSVQTGLPEREQHLQKTEQERQSRPQDPVAIAHFARCTFAVAELSTDQQHIITLCNAGMQSIASVDVQASAELDYLYALNLGLLMQADMLTALGRVTELQQRLEHALQQPQLDQGGPLRVLGMLYLQAPPWPTSIGDVDQATELLAQAVRLYPDYPHNQIFYAQALLAANRAQDAEIALAEAERALAQRDWGAATARWQLHIAELKSHLQRP